MSPPFPKLKLTYLNIKGRGEPTRLALQIGGIPFEDERISLVTAKANRSMAPFGQVPVLLVNDTIQIAQSQAILRYVGTLAGLFPAADPLKAALVSQICLFVEDITQAVVVVLFTSDAESQPKAHESFVTEKAPTMLAALEKVIEKHSGGKWAVGDSLTIADLCIYYAVDLVTSYHFPEITMDTVGSKSRIAAIYQAVHDHPKVMEWNAAHKK